MAGRAADAGAEAVRWALKWIAAGVVWTLAVWLVLEVVVYVWLQLR